MEVVRGPVKLVGTAFQADINNCPRLPTVIRPLIFLVIKFLDRIQRQVTCRSSFNSSVIQNRLSIIGIVVIGSIHRVIIVVRTVAVRGRGMEPTTWNALYSGTQFEQVLEVPPLQRQLVNGLVRQGSAQHIGGSVDNGS